MVVDAATDDPAHQLGVDPLLAHALAGERDHGVGVEAVVDDLERVGVLREGDDAPLHLVRDARVPVDHFQLLAGRELCERGRGAAGEDGEEDEDREDDEVAHGNSFLLV